LQYVCEGFIRLKSFILRKSPDNSAYVNISPIEGEAPREYTDYRKGKRPRKIRTGKPFHLPCPARWKNMLKTLKSKVSLVYISLVVIIVLLGIYSLMSMYQISKAVDNLIVTNYNSIQRLDQMKEALNTQNAILLDYFYTQDQAVARSKYQEQMEIFETNCQKEYNTIIIPREMEMITNIKTTYDDFTAMLPEMLKAGGQEKEYRYYTEKVVPKIAEVKAAMGELVASNETALFARKQEAKDVVQHSTFMLSLIFLLAVAISFFTSRMYTDKLFKPLYEITQNLRAVRQGNMNRKSNVKTEDELGVLAAEFNNMTQRLMEFEQSTMGELLGERNRTFAIVRSITEPMVILDRESKVTLTNQSFERLFGIPMEDAVGRHFLEVVWQSRLNEFSKVDYRSHTYSEQVVRLGNGENAKFFNVMVTPLDYDGKVGPDAAIIVLYDITALKALDRKRSDFIATISHEFKTPLTSIVMGIDLLESDAVGKLTGDQQEIVGTLREDSERLCNLVSDLLELSRIESSSTIYHYEPCRIEEIIQEPLRQFGPLAKNGGVALASELEQGLPAISADPAKITWVINNLLSNAVKYTKEGDSITVRAYADADHITVEVEDTGVGIPKEYLERIFDKYVQVTSYDLEMRGSGLGLAVARSIIAAHGGRIWCESEMDHGSKFIFTLPVSPKGGRDDEKGTGRGRHEEYPADADEMLRD